MSAQYVFPQSIIAAQSVSVAHSVRADVLQGPAHVLQAASGLVGGVAQIDVPHSAAQDEHMQVC